MQRMNERDPTEIEAKLRGFLSTSRHNRYFVRKLRKLDFWISHVRKTYVDFHADSRLNHELKLQAKEHEDLSYSILHSAGNSYIVPQSRFESSWLRELKEVSKTLVDTISTAWDNTCWAILFSKRQCKLLGIMLDYLSIPCMHLSVSLTATYEKVMLYGFAEKESWFYTACNRLSPVSFLVL